MPRISEINPFPSQSWIIFILVSAVTSRVPLWHITAHLVEQVSKPHLGPDSSLEHDTKPLQCVIISIFVIICFFYNTNVIKKL